MPFAVEEMLGEKLYSHEAVCSTYSFDMHRGSDIHSGYREYYKGI